MPPAPKAATTPSLRHEDRTAKRAPLARSQGRQSRRHGHVLHNVKHPDDRRRKTDDGIVSLPWAAIDLLFRLGAGRRRQRASVLCRPSSVRSAGGGERIRTADPLLAKQVLSQLSYTPKRRLGLERDAETAARSKAACKCQTMGTTSGRSAVRSPPSVLRKEVIQPQVPLRLPCYDFTPVADLTVDGCLLAVSTPASGKTNSHGVTGGVYKARERIHRGMLIRDY